MILKQCIFTENDCYKRGVTIVPKGVMVHSTGAKNPWLRRYVQPDDGRLGKNTNANDWNRPGLDVCVHAFIGKTADGTVAVYQTLPWDLRGWHAGRGPKGSANDSHISFEICEDCLTDSAYYAQAIQASAELTAYLCKLFGLDPLRGGVVIDHREGNSRGIASNHGDPEHIWRQLGLPYTMESFRRDVAARLSKEVPENPVYITYTVRKGDTLSGIGAEYGVAWYKLAEYNSLADPGLIYPGQIIKIPADELPDEAEPVSYTVQAGDSLWKISRQLLGSGWRFTEIMQLNGLRSISIKPGDVLEIPRE